MLNGDCRRKFDFSSKPVCAHRALLWSDVLYMYDWKKITGRQVILSDRRNICQRAIQKWSVLIRRLTIKGTDSAITETASSLGD
jgi:uncharacterized protein